jgi:drug/metabolite transporter (DMT)-like permease
MNWIVLVVVAQLLLAGVVVIDKYILTSKKVEKPFVLAFYVSALTIFSLLIFLIEFIPFPASWYFMESLQFPSIFNIERPTPGFIAMALVAGFTFFQALVSLYSTFKQADVSDVVPVVGSITAVMTFILNWIINGEVLHWTFFAGFILLVVGTALISSLRLNRDLTLSAIHSGIMFALNATMMNSMFKDTNFDHAFFWSRIGTIFIMLSILLIPRYFRKITENTQKTGATGGLWVLGKTALAGASAFLILKAIELGDVVLVQALGGLQFVFLMFFSLFMGHMTPVEFGENNSLKDIVHKLIGVAIILAGFFYLFI